jgi:hypothetical protein
VNIEPHFHFYQYFVDITWDSIICLICSFLTMGTVPSVY